MGTKSVHFTQNNFILTLKKYILFITKIYLLNVLLNLTQYF